MADANLNENLNIVSESGLDIQLLDGDLNIIQKLDDEPNDVGGMTSAELKATFDKAGNIIKDYLNNQLIPAILAADATEAARAEAEAARQSAETGREQAENERVSAEEARASGEETRQSNETARKNAETSREDAETGRASAEDQRASAEASRVTAEKGRVTAEQEREDKESSRQTAELWRLEAEAERVAAEQARADENAGIVAQATEKAVEAASSAASAASSEKTAGEAADSACADRLEAQYIARVIQHGQLPTDLPTNLILEAGKAVTYSATDTEPYTVPTVAKSLELGRRYQVLISGAVYAEFLWTGKTVYVRKESDEPGTYLVSVSGEMSYDQTTYKLTLQNGTMGFEPNSGRSLTVTLKAVDDSALPPSRGIELDNTLTKEGKAADAAAVGDALSTLSEEKATQADVDKLKHDLNKLNEGGLNLKDEIIGEDINNWLNEHPEATTTVQNGSLTSDKFSTEAKEWIRGARVYNIKDYGAVGDGVHNDAPAIRQAIAALPASNFVLYFPPGRYMQGDGTNPDYTRVVNGIPYPDADIGTPLNFVLEDKSNFDIYGYGATIIAHPDNSCIKNTGFFVLTRCSNATVRGFEYIGNISSRAPQWGDGGRYNNQNAFEINGCTDVALYDNHVDGAVMDGYMINKFTIRVGEYIFSERVHLLNCTAINCYRQGLSICGGKNLTIEKCRFSGTGTVYGTAPMNSVDVEATYGSGHFIFKECIFENSQSGIGINFCDNAKNSVVEDCVFVNDTLNMANSKSASDNSGITIKGCKISNNTIKTATINTEMSCVENNVFDRCILYFTSFKKYGVKSVFRNNMVCFMHFGDLTETKEVSTLLGSKTVVSSQSVPILAPGENVEVLMEGNTFINAFGSVHNINQRADVSIDNCIFVCDFDYLASCDYIGINTMFRGVPLGAGNKYDKSVLFLDTAVKNPLNRDSQPLFFYASIQNGISAIDINIGHKTEHYNALGFFEFFKLSFNGKAVNIIINNNKGQLHKVVIDDNIKILPSDLQFAFAEIDDVRHIYITSSTNSKVNRNYKLEYTTSRGTAHFDNLISVGTTDIIQDGLTWYGEDGEIVS